ncbi:MAG: hypothetical protein EA383_15140, partial [Spirochaetaceae bacterium]
GRGEAPACMMAVMPPARKSQPRHSPLSLVFLVWSLIATAWFAIWPAISGAAASIDLPLRLFCIISALSIAALQVGAFVVPRTAQYRGLLSVLMITLWLRLALCPPPLTDGPVIATLIVLAVVLYEPFPINLVVSVGLVAISSAVLLFSQSPGGTFPAEVLRGIGTTIFLGVTLAVLGSLVSRSRQQTVVQQSANDQLTQQITELTEANVSSLSYAMTIDERSRAEERGRLTREIHDIVGYTLTTNITLMEAAKLMVHSEPERVSGFVETIRANTEDALAKVRRVLRDLRAEVQPDDDLNALLMKIRRVFSYSTGVDVTLQMGNAKLASLEEYRDLIAGFLKEAFINSFRHGKARKIEVFFWARLDVTEITVTDDGVGSQVLVEDIGIQGMRERAARVGGTVHIPPVRLGFTIVLTVPRGVTSGN